MKMLAYTPAGQETVRCSRSTRGGDGRPEGQTQTETGCGSRCRRETSVVKKRAHLEEHVHLGAHHHDLQRHRGHRPSVRLGHVLGETEAVHLLVGVAVQEEDRPAALSMGKQ